MQARAVQRRNRANGTLLAAPNALWCADFKGKFKLGNGRYCYPLTVSDHASRYLLLCEALESSREALSSRRFSRCSATRPAGRHPKRQDDVRPLRIPGGALAAYPHQQPARAYSARNQAPHRVVGAFPDGHSALNLAAARLRHIAGTAWSTKRYLNIELLKEQQMRGAIPA